MSSEQSTPKARDPGDVIFHPQKAAEYGLSQQQAGLAPHFGVRPKWKTYACGACGNSNSGRVLCEVVRQSDQSRVLWCACSCEKCEPTVLIEKGGVVTSQLPLNREFTPSPGWPQDLARLYDEAAKSFSAGAYTSCATVCRKVLMATACNEGDEDGKSFTEYVNFITNTLLTVPKARASIDRIRSIGNDANHNIAFVSLDDARRAVQIVTYMLTVIYSVPAP